MNIGRLFLSFVIASYLFYPFFLGDSDYSLFHHFCAPLLIPFFLFVVGPLFLGNPELPVVGLSKYIAMFLGLTAELYAALWYFGERRYQSVRS